MTRFLRRAGLSTALLFLLSLVVAASPKIAIVKVNSGSVTLDGVTIVKAAMAAEGQVLEMSEGAEVRIQLLGSRDEAILSGEPEFLITKNSLRDKAIEVGRNSATVAEDIGNRNTALALVKRDKVTKPGPDLDLDLDPSFPPVLEDGQYVIFFRDGDPIELLPGQSVAVNVNLVNSDQVSLERVFKYPDPLLPVGIAKEELETGKPYRLTVTFTSPNEEEPICYGVTFLQLTPDQEEFLRDAEQAFLQEYSEGTDVYPLLRLAALFQEYEQSPKVLEYLRMAYNSPHLGDKTQWDSLDDTIQRLERALTMSLPRETDENN